MTSVGRSNRSNGPGTPLIESIDVDQIVIPELRQTYRLEHSTNTRHNLFLHSALVLSRKVPRSVHGIKNVLGNWSSKLFAVALLASGQSSTITGTYAGQYVMQVY
nr:unnamed protein product [Digitaria exilis]